MRIPGDFGIMPPVDPDGKPRGTDRARKSEERGNPDIIEISVYGKRLSADFISRKTRAGHGDGLDSGARARIEQRLASGFYERDDVLAVLADRLIDVFGL